MQHPKASFLEIAVEPMVWKLAHLFGHLRIEFLGQTDLNLLMWLAHQQELKAGLAK